MRIPVPLLVASALMAAAAAQAQDQMEAAPLVAPFSSAKPGGPLPRGWIPFSLGGGKRLTDYQMVDNQGRTVLHARAKSAASALTHAVNFDVHTAPIVEWRWKVGNLIERADDSVASQEDSPARLVLGCNGDRSRFGILER